MKGLRVFAGLFSALLLLSGCSSRSYRSDRSAADLAAALCEAAAIRDPIAAGAEDLAPIPASFGSAPEIAVCYAADSADLDEIGVWKAGEADVRSVAVFLQARLAERFENNAAYYDTYMPEETPKLRDAEVRVYGSYAVWAVLSPEAKSACFRAAEKALTG